MAHPLISGLNIYTVSLEMFDRDEPLILTIATEAGLDNCDEDFLKSDIEEHLLNDYGIDIEDVACWDFV